MSFLNAAMLWALPLAAVPVIFHLLNRRRRNVLRWAAMQFLAVAATRTRRKWKLSEWLLLLLRTAAVMALILAMARPLVRSRWLASSGPRDIIIVLDTTLSTAQTAQIAQTAQTAGVSQADGSADVHDAAPRLFDHLVAQAARVIDDLGPNDVCRILLASTAPRWLVAEPVWGGPQTRSLLHERLSQVEPTPAGTDWRRCIETAAAAPAGNSEATRLITVLTDGQALGWQAETPHAWTQVKNKLQAMPAGAFVHVCVPAAPTEEPANVCIEEVTAPRYVVGAGELLSITAVLRNSGKVASPAGVAIWHARSRVLETSVVPAMQPGQATTITMEWTGDVPGTTEVLCSINVPDALVLDNVDGVVVETVEQVRVLVVDGTSRSDAVWTDTGYLLTALGEKADPGGAWRPALSAEAIDITELPRTRLEDYACVVLANVSVLPGVTLPRLREYVRQGGGLWIVLGDQTMPSTFVGQFASGAGRLSPLELLSGDAQSPDIPSGSSSPDADYVRVAARPHAATRLLDDADHLDLDQVRIRRRHAFAPADLPKPPTVLLATGAGDPLAFESSYGGGRIIVQGFPLNVGWSNLPASQAFVVMVHEWLWYLAEPSLTRRNLASGEPVEVMPATDDVAGVGRLLTPWRELVVVEPVTRDGRQVLRYANTAVPGRYEMAISRSNGQQETSPFRVRRDARESDLTVLSPAELQHLQASGGMTFSTEPLAVAARDGASAAPEPAWSMLLAVLVVVLAAESILAGWTGARKQRIAVTGRARSAATSQPSASTW